MAKKDPYSTFSKRISLRANNFEKKSTNIVLTAAGRVHEALVWATPVDTGKVRSNWTVRLGSASRQVVPPFVPYRKRSGMDLNETANALATIQAGKTVLVRFSPGQTINISNNVEYLSYLNEGFSPQAEPRFIQDAIKRGIIYLRGQKVLEIKTK